ETSPDQLFAETKRRATCSGSEFRAAISVPYGKCEIAPSRQTEFDAGAETFFYFGDLVLVQRNARGQNESVRLSFERKNRILHRDGERYGAQEWQRNSVWIDVLRRQPHLSSERMQQVYFLDQSQVEQNCAERLPRYSLALQRPVELSRC